MKLPRLNVYVMAAIVLIAMLVSYCSPDNPGSKSNPVKVSDPWLGHSDSAHYVGINTCRQCHDAIYQTFIKTGMGQSFDSASRKKSAGKFDSHTVIYDKQSNFYYHPFWRGNKYFIKEFRLEKGDTTYSRTEQVSFIIGSGQHTNSHIFNTQGYLHQMPMTFYTQKGFWDLPPGFENGSNTRFSRKIGLECMSCHNAYPDFVIGSENKYNRVMNGIDCERCHGPGSIHVDRKQHGEKIDTSLYTDYSIVNPGKLTVDRQFDVCMRCHLQGDAVLKPGKSFYDFRPGQKLSDFITVFMPKYKGAEDQFIMASHAARLKMSKCFMKSMERAQQEKGNALRPYKNALTCVTCHNPHVSVKVTGKEVFNTACRNCHASGKTDGTCSESPKARMLVSDNCVSCHMPRSGSTDIPHVTVHDHYIRKPEKPADIKAVKTFIGLYAVNDDHPTPATRALGYVNYYEKFDPKHPALLDSALANLPTSSQAQIRANLDPLVQIYFLRKDFKTIAMLIDKAGIDWLLQEGLAKTNWSNTQAWTAYRIGEAYAGLGNNKEAEMFYAKAIALEPFNLDFRNKHGTVLLEADHKEQAAREFDYIISEDPDYASAWSNRGRIYFYARNFAKADSCYDKALALDPDMLAAMKNKVDLYNEQQEYARAKAMLLKIQKHFPSDKGSKALLDRMKQLKLI
jgi:tetratricopeptide (TPR) repeat protein